jgi:hypothetical protein
MMAYNEDLQRTLHQLLEEHRHLDQTISNLRENPYGDQFLITRLKKRKLLLKDTIERLNSQLIPDLNA